MIDFLGIGAQKAGTTWLAENLRVHPDVFIPERKELHYFDNKWNRPLSDYAHHFAEAAGQVRGEITPAYGILDPERIRYVARILPDLRLILLLRNPIERAWSHALMDLASRRGRDPAEVPTQEVIRFLESDVAGRRGDYLAILDAWGADFPREQLYVGFFEWIHERPRELLGDVFRHIGVSPEVHWDRFPLGKVIVPLVSPDQKGHTVESLEGSGPARSNRHPCPEPVRRWLEAHYADDIERLAERLGGPADAWRSG
jgi:hypothetical protein